MTILFLATLPPTSSTIIGRTIPLALACISRGHDAHIVTLGYSRSRDKNQGPVPLEVVGPSLRSAETLLPSFWTTLQRLRAGSRSLAHSARAKRPDCVVLVKPHPQNCAAVGELSCPVVLDADDDERWASRLSFLERVYLARTEKRAARLASLVTVCSPALLDRYTLELRARTVALIPTGITPTTTPAKSLREHFHIAPTAPIILYLGSVALSSGHRVDHVLDVWDRLAQQVQDLHFVIAGDGIDEASMRHRVATLRHHGRVHFTGRFAADEAEGLTQQATLLVDPVDDSPASRAKSSSRTLLALLTGTPIIAGDVGIRRLFLPPSIRAWALYPPGNPTALLGALVHGLTTQAREHFQRETKGLWQQWSWDRLGHQFVTHLERIRR